MDLDATGELAITGLSAVRTLMPENSLRYERKAAFLSAPQLMVSVDGVLHLRTLTADYVYCGLDSVIQVFCPGDS